MSSKMRQLSNSIAIINSYIANQKIVFQLQRLWSQNSHAWTLLPKMTITQAKIQSSIQQSLISRNISKMTVHPIFVTMRVSKTQDSLALESASVNIQSKKSLVFFKPSKTCLNLKPMSIQNCVKTNSMISGPDQQSLGTFNANKVKHVMKSLAPLTSANQNFQDKSTKASLRAQFLIWSG